MALHHNYLSGRSAVDEDCSAHVQLVHKGEKVDRGSKLKLLLDLYSQGLCSQYITKEKHYFMVQ